MITEDVWDQGTKEERAVKAADWSPTAAQEMCDRVLDLSCPYGGTLGDIFGKTPKGAITNVFLEESLSRHGTKAVLLGDGKQTTYLLSFRRTGFSVSALLTLLPLFILTAPLRFLALMPLSETPFVAPSPTIPRLVFSKICYEKVNKVVTR